MSLKNKNYILFFCMALILFDFMGLTITIVTFPKLLLSSKGIMPDMLNYNHKYALMAILMALYPIGQFLGAATLGKLSDHWGRKSTLLLSLTGTSLGFLLTAVSVNLSLIPILFISRFITGIFSGNVSIAQATISDISNEQTKGKNLTLAQAAMGSAWIFGPILGAYLSEPIFNSHFNLSTPYWVFCGLFLLLMLFVIFKFQDTVNKHEVLKINLLQGIQQIVRGFTSKRLRFILFVWFLFVCGWWLFEAFMPAYLFKHFNYSTIDLGHLLTYNGVIFVFCQFFIVSKIIKHILPSKLVKSSAFIAGIAMIALTLAHNNIMIYSAMTFFVISMAFTLPGFITSISNREQASSQGQIMGIVNSIQSFATILVILAGGFLHYIHPSMNIVLGGIITILAWAIYTLFIHKK